MGDPALALIAGGCIDTRRVILADRSHTSARYFIDAVMGGLTRRCRSTCAGRRAHAGRVLHGHRLRHFSDDAVGQVIMAWAAAL